MMAWTGIKVNFSLFFQLARCDQTMELQSHFEKSGRIFSRYFLLAGSGIIFFPPKFLH
jgi:hypothetical protein